MENKPNVWANCFWMVAPLAIGIFTAPFSLFIVLPGAIWGLATMFGGPTSAHRQVGRSVFIGCALGVVFLVVAASQW